MNQSVKFFLANVNGNKIDGKKIYGKLQEKSIYVEWPKNKKRERKRSSFSLNHLRKKVIRKMFIILI